MPPFLQTQEAFDLVKSTCLTVRKALGSWMTDNLVVVGGLVPSLIIDQNALPPGVLPHPGTVDLDLGMPVATLEDTESPSLEDRLSSAGFSPADEDDSIGLRWRINLPGLTSAPVDFLTSASDIVEAGKPNTLRLDFWPMAMEGLSLAMVDNERVLLSGKTLSGEEAAGEVLVCGPGAFLVLKSIAFKERKPHKPKDAFDLWFVLQYYGEGIQDVVERFLPLKEDPAAAKALGILGEDFAEPEFAGPLDVCRFSGLDLETAEARNRAADVAGSVREFLRLTDEDRSSS